MDKVNDKLLKVIALAKHGVGGERTAAIATAKRICATHGLDYDEVMGSAETAKIHEYTLDIKWRNKLEEDMLAQVCLKFACTPENPDLFFNSYRKVFIYNTTAAKHLETINAASVYLHQFRKERKNPELAAKAGKKSKRLPKAVLKTDSWLHFEDQPDLKITSAAEGKEI